MTVVTPVLDRAGVIEDCLRSVAAQRYPHVQHIVADGGSTDGTLQILERWAARGDIELVHGPDRGMYDAINKGLARARGDVLSYLNSDDVWLPWTLERAVEVLRDGADLAFGDLVRIVPRGDRTELALQFYRDFDLNLYTHERALAQPTVVWWRRVTDVIGTFDDSYRLLGDCELWLRAGAHGHRFVHVGDVQAVQVDHDETLRATQAERMRTEFARLRADYREAAGAPRPARTQHVSRSVHWRRDQLRLARELARPQPRRWPEFIGFLRDHGVAADPAAVVRYLLPERLRPEGLAWLDPDAFLAALLQEPAPT